MIAALMVGSFMAVVLNNVFGESKTGIHMVGALPEQFPPLSAPEFDIQVFKDLAPAALAMTLFALTEAVSIARSISIKSGQPLSGNQEFIGQGLSNVIGSFFSAYVATGSFNRSAANYDAGAKTPLAAVFAGGILLAFIPFLAPVTAYLPTASVSGLLFLVAWRLIDFKHIKKIIRVDRTEAAIMGLTFPGDIVPGAGIRVTAGCHPVADDLPAKNLPAKAVVSVTRPEYRAAQIYLRRFLTRMPPAQNPAP